MKIVISVGGSMIVPGENVNIPFLKKLKKTVNKLKKKHKLVIVTGGGYTARKYIKALRDAGVNENYCSLAGIKTTKLNATLVSLFLDANIHLPDSLAQVSSYLKKYPVVVCGALGFQPDMTSDGDSAQISNYIKADLFINMTDVPGLYTKNPKKHKDAKFIPEISFKDFWSMISKMKYKAGQHFVLDQFAARVIKKHKIKTVILKGLDNLEKYVEGKSFKGTVIQ
ncbi:UMP kinase [Nanoarchaeota archaeon]